MDAATDVFGISIGGLEAAATDHKLSPEEETFQQFVDGLVNKVCTCLACKDTSQDISL